MKTFSQKPADVTRKWHLIDATNVPMGRIATTAATLLIGKHKPSVTSHVDGGDFVVIINADQMLVTGAKAEKKTYHYHSGYPGGLRTQKISDIGNVAALEEAVRGMLPRNKLVEGRFARLKVFSGSEHKHTAQTPHVYELKGKK